MVNLARMVKSTLRLQFLESTWQEKKQDRPCFGRTHQDPEAKWTRVACSSIIKEQLVETSANKAREGRRQWKDYPKTMTAENMKTERKGWRLETFGDQIRATPKYWRRIASLCQHRAAWASILRLAEHELRHLLWLQLWFQGLLGHFGDTVIPCNTM